ncbi:hypothetical protein V1283_007041 [Bradyrhizobium sp. AZCC 2262]
MFGKPTIGSNQQCRDSVALGFEPAIANPFDASRNPQSRELPHAKGDPYGSPAPISQESVVAGAGFERAKLSEPQGEKSASAPRADHPANAIVQDRALAWKSVVWCPGRETYATTDTRNRCLSLVWWRECLARWRRFPTSRTPPSRVPPGACRSTKRPVSRHPLSCRKTASAARRLPKRRGSGASRPNGPSYEPAACVECRSTPAV